MRFAWREMMEAMMEEDASLEGVDQK